MAFNKVAYNNAYNKDKYIGVSFRVNRETEKHIADALKAQPNIKEYICKLITADQKRKERKAGFVRSRADRKIHANIDKYPFEVIEQIGHNDRYVVGFADSYDAAVALQSSYTASAATGPVVIYHRFYDPDLRVNAAVAVDME